MTDHKASPPGGVTKSNGAGLAAGGAFLVTIGIVVAAAFFYPFMSRRGHSLWQHSSQSPHAFKVLMIGGCTGLALVFLGMVMLQWPTRQQPSIRAHRPKPDPESKSD